MLSSIALANDNFLMEGFKKSMGARYDEAVARIETEEATCGVLSESSVREQCSLAFFSQADVRECLEKKVTESEKTLKDAEKAALDKLAQWDNDDHYIDAARKAIAVSGKTFIQYRKDHCALAASMAGGAIGAAIKMGRDACIAELNNRRAKQLRDFVANLPLKEPQPPQ
jgi:uncharacterized protein YecT (DUF1311 family)